MGGFLPPFFWRNKMIKINEGNAVSWDGYCYHLFKWDEGGKETNYKGKKVVSEAGWKPQNKYFPKLNHAIKYLANGGASNTEDLQSFLEKYAEIVNSVKIEHIEEELK
jgi:hypothetical protein